MLIGANIVSFLDRCNDLSQLLRYPLSCFTVDAPAFPFIDVLALPEAVLSLPDVSGSLFVHMHPPLVDCEVSISKRRSKSYCDQ